jgi:uncharacterized membrane protein
MSGLQIGMINPLNQSKKLVKVSIIRIRLMLGEWTALALSLLVATDVLDTVLRPSHAFEMNDVLKMCLFTVIRTGVAYFLAKEIKELELDENSPSSNDHHLLHDDAVERPISFTHIDKEESDSGNTSQSSLSDLNNSSDSTIQKNNLQRRRKNTRKNT